MNFWKSLLALIADDKGQVGDEPEPEGDQASLDEEDAGAEGAETSEGEEAQPEESFIDPSQLPEELKPHWKRMHAAFSSKMKGIKDSRDKLDAYNRFFEDPEYAKQTIMAVAPKLGLNINGQAAPQQAPGQQAQQRATDVPPELVEAVRNNLAPELQWMADSIAASHWAANKVALKPIMDRFDSDRTDRFTREYESAAEELAAKVPGWETKEDDMTEMLDFIQDKTKLRHPVFGNKLELIYNMTTGNTRATQEAINRMSQAGRNRSSISSSTRHPVTNISQRVKEAKNEAEAWDIAAQGAIQEVGNK